MALKTKVKRSENADSYMLVELFEEFITEKEAKNLSPATIFTYRKTFHKFKEFIGDDDTADKMNKEIIFKWIGTMKQDGVKHATINHYLSEIRAFLYWCMDSDRGYIKKPFKISLVKGQEEPPEVYTDEQLTLLLEKPHRQALYTEWRMWTIVNWIMGTGNRASTVCNVKLEDISFASREIILGHTKNKKAQIIPLSSSLETVLKEWIRMWRTDAAKQSDYLFANISNEKLTTSALRTAFRKYSKDRNVDRTDIHGIRHTFAKHYILSGGNMVMLQKILGHKTLDMTRKYVNLYSEDMKQGFDAHNPLDNFKKSLKRNKAVKRAE